MADYREISQQYAQGAIRAVILVNSGAAVAVLSQMSSLLALLSAASLGWALIAYIIGVVCGVLAWVSGFYNARYVDIAERSGLMDYSTANRWQLAGAILLLTGLVFFLAGCLALACSFLAVDIVPR